MTSKKLFFKLIFSDIKRRIWAVALLILAFFFSYPVAAAFLAGSVRQFDYMLDQTVRYQEYMRQLFSINESAASFLIVAAALVCGMSTCSYLTSRRKVDLYHSLPVSRMKLYASSYVGGILIMVIPYLVMVCAGLVIALANGADPAPLVLPAIAVYGINILYFLLMYSIVVVSVMLTGNLVVCFLGVLVLNLIFPMITTLIQGMMSTFFSTYYNQGQYVILELMGRLSPFFEYLRVLDDWQLSASYLPIYLADLIAFGVLTFLAAFFYYKRPSEAAGKAMAFECSKPIIRCVLVVYFALMTATFFWNLLESTGWMLFGLICGGVITHGIIEIIYHFDFKKLFCHKIQLATCLVVALGIFGIFRYDVFGFDRFIPNESQVACVVLDIPELRSWVDYGEPAFKVNPDTGETEYYWNYKNAEEILKERMTEIPVSPVLDLVRNRVRHADQETDRPAGYNEYDDRLYSTYVTYQMTSGRNIYRQYVVSYEDLKKPLDQLLQNQNFLQAYYPVLTQTGSDIAEVFVHAGQTESELADWTVEEKAELLQTYQKEFDNLDMETRRNTVPSGALRFASEDVVRALHAQQSDGSFRYNKDYRYGYTDYSGISDHEYYPIYPGFTKTMQLLEQKESGITKRLTSELRDTYSDGSVYEIYADYGSFYHKAN